MNAVLFRLMKASIIFFLIAALFAQVNPTFAQPISHANPILMQNKLSITNLKAAKLAAGKAHTCVLTTTGGVKCWGQNIYHQLGDGTTVDHNEPVTVSGLSNGVINIAANDDTTCVVMSYGGVKCWPYTYFEPNPDFTPVAVPGLSSGVSALAVGTDHICALTTGGAVKCWGKNWSGQLGDGTTTESSTPVNVIGLTSGVLSISAGLGHTCALITGGAVKCWGLNEDGQIGDGTTTSRLTPVSVLSLTNGVTAIDAGESHTCAVAAGGALKCWGNNFYGILGDGTYTNRSVPGPVTGLSSGVSSISAGGEHTCALTNAGGVKCWGQNDTGELGDGTITVSLVPVDVVGLSSGVVAIEANGVASGKSHTCAIVEDGKVMCWGTSDWYSGYLGSGYQENETQPAGVIGTDNDIANVFIGNVHTCALTSAGVAKCWGWNKDGQLGIGSFSQRLIPTDVTNLASGVKMLVAGFDHTCALTESGGVKCWGRNNYGQLGDGTTTTRMTPVDVVGLSSGVASISANSQHTCAVTTAGGAKCWGLNYDGQLGDNTVTNRLAPVDVIGLTSGVSAIAAGGGHTCALTTGGGVKCWGSNMWGKLGDNTETERHTPVDVIGLSSGVAMVSTSSYDHTCALTTTGGVKCWGKNLFGQLGDGTTSYHNVPLDVFDLTQGVISISAGSDHTCALTSTGGVKCWGLNDVGQLGDGTTTTRLVPSNVNGLTAGVIAVAASGVDGSNYVTAGRTCAVTTTNEAKCWGSNYYGQLGNGGAVLQAIPVYVYGFGSLIQRPTYSGFLPSVMR
jgi:alpha-tubulin suppressor-like RCC1 family protein